jgi:hypothetical protein
MAPTAVRPWPAHSSAKARCSAATARASGRVRGGRSTMSRISAQPTCRSFAPNRSSQDRRTAAIGRASSNWSVAAQPISGRTSAGRFAGTSEMLGRERSDGLAALGDAQLLVLPRSQAGKLPGERRPVGCRLRIIFRQCGQPAIPAGGQHLRGVQVIKSGEVRRGQELAAVVPWAQALRTPVTRQDWHQAGALVGVAEHGPGPRGVRHFLAGQPRHRIPRAEGRANPVAGREGDRADPQSPVPG